MDLRRAQDIEKRPAPTMLLTRLTDVEMTEAFAGVGASDVVLISVTSVLKLGFGFFG